MERMTTYRGIPGTRMLYHGEWADPEILVDVGDDCYLVNFWDVEDEIVRHIDFARSEYPAEYADMTDNDIAQSLSEIVEEIAQNYGELCTDD